MQEASDSARPVPCRKLVPVRETCAMQEASDSARPVPCRKLVTVRDLCHAGS